MESNTASSTPPDNPAPKTPADPPMPLPTARLLVWFAILVGAITLAPWGLGVLYGWSAETVNGAIAGGIASAVTVLLSLVALKPWKPRPAADWALYWIGSSTIRLLVTPLALFSVYSATLLPGRAVLLGGAAAFFAALVVETAVIARAVLQASQSSRASAS